MSLSAKCEYLAKIHGRVYGRAWRLHKTCILDEFCANCGYHRKAAPGLLHRPLEPVRHKRLAPSRPTSRLNCCRCSKVIWLESDQMCSKLLKTALPEWLFHYERRYGSLPVEVKKKLLAIRSAQIDRLPAPGARAPSPHGALRNPARHPLASASAHP